MRLFVLTALLVPCLSFQETHHFVHLMEDGKTIHQDIIHDKNENTVLVIVGDVSMYKHAIPTINYHDYNTGYVAFKDIKREMCSLSRVPFPKPSLELFRQGVSNETMRFTGQYDSAPLTNSKVREIAGSKIAEFCKDYVTFSRTLIPNQMDKRSGENADEPCSSFCVWCVIHSDLPPPNRNGMESITIG
ncbi:uncharacterized protein LOC132729516 [Ruditapes philippinarum]|uniref:uncharacterized protein LOC132729516 n=1 Tax=Ruditapes philippinarum TaxID=129788 RepID=UPI00295C0B74|nr:uncharacterized protein LOC132729516 [Ruditapes philippinarum]